MHTSLAKLSQKTVVLLLCLFLSFGATGCAKHDAQYNAAGVYDPIEPFNRGVFAFNNVLDKIIIEPVATVYNTIVPDFVRDAVQNFMRNLKSPLIIANNLLQGNIGGAGAATARFIINTTAGIGGLVDVASAQGFSYVPEDFGQTLATWGFGDGFYLVLPVLGPSSLRDTAGLAGDYLADPVRIYAHNTDNDWIYYTRNVVEAVDTRSRLLKSIRDLRRNSIDYYAAMRSAYSQKRHALIKNQDPEKMDIPAYDEQN